ncbi:TetR/AcrR family transcriptional regulator [Rhizobium alvei]|uniref:TetR/AcrR family transcriptional regulator n=1 Tax=Rhizobium alvei TaxID=1132659 RepID=A0ABT8YR07_9HYPH|nr:TetR/AcrR family transcriptional regulator [Rhizobium alvei]MDO6966150.1 TetR/AcrR family transcriptional regulator [Rhizobium alvei]
MKDLPADFEIHPPQQERTQASWERILEAGLRLLEEEGYDGFTIAAICARANVSPTAIYARVRTKKALFLAVFEHGFGAVRQETEATRARLKGSSPDAVIRGAVAAIALTTFAHQRFHRPVILRAEIDDEIALRTRQARTETATWFRDIVLRHSGAQKQPNPERIDRCFRVIFAALMARVATPSALDVGLVYSDESFIADLQDTAVNWLLLAPAS